MEFESKMGVIWVIWNGTTHGHPAPNAFTNAETSKKLNNPSLFKSAFGLLDAESDTHCETSKKLSTPSPLKSAVHRSVFGVATKTPMVPLLLTTGGKLAIDPFWISGLSPVAMGVMSGHQTIPENPSSSIVVRDRRIAQARTKSSSNKLLVGLKPLQRCKELFDLLRRGHVEHPPAQGGNRLERFVLDQ